MLAGIVGSRAYGLNTEDSDYDRLGIFVAPTEEILGLSQPKDTIHSTDPDLTYHEISKYLRLALAANPTVLELLFLPEYETITYWGEHLVEIRKAFLSNAINNSYAGYAKQQFERLKRRGDFSSTLKKRTAKHQMHMGRLLSQGLELKTTGDLQVKVRDPEKLRAISRMSIEEVTEWWEAADAEFKNAPSILPDKPNYDIVNQYLLDVRRDYYSASD